MIRNTIILLLVLGLAGLGAVAANEVENAETESTAPNEADTAFDAQAPEEESSTADSQENSQDEETETIESIVEEWRRTLTYGIDSEVLELLPQLREDERRELSQEVLGVLEITLNDEVRLEALQYLTDLEITAAAPTVVSILTRDSDEESGEVIRESLRYAEDVIADPSEELLEAVHNLSGARDSRIAARAVRALGTLGSGDDASQLMDLYEERGTPEYVRQAVLLSLGEMKDLGDPDRAAALLLSIAEDTASESTSRYYAIDSLSKIGSEEGRELFEDLLSSDDAILRSYAIAALSRYEGVSETLTRALRDSFWRVRVSALQGIADSRAAEALPAVKYKLERDPEMRVRYEAVKTVAAFDTTDTWQYLRDLYTNERTPVSVRNAIAEQLIEKDLSDSLTALATVIEQEWEREGSTLLDYAAKTLSQTEHEELGDVYAKLLTHPNFIIQIYGIRGIGLNRYRGFREDLSAFAENEAAHRALRSNAQASLEALDATE